MLSIIGGTYHERCVFPAWDEIFGSGLRACISIQELVDDVTFYTFANPRTSKYLENLSRHYGFELNIYSIDYLLKFQYLHGLSAPHITPQLSNLNKPVNDEIELDNLLKYGVLEGDIVTHAKKVVYDPQSPDNPSFYDSNGSTAEELAIVINSIEAKLLLGKEDVFEAGKNLLEKAKVVIIKRGSKGAIVFTGDNHQRIPAYETDYVWKIGSGDIFSAVFSACWAELDLDPFKAANIASQATAVFCNSTALPLRKDFYKPNNFNFEELKIKTDSSKKDEYDLYLASPFFSLSEYWLLNEARKCLSSNNLKIFSPIHDVGKGKKYKDITEQDLKGLNNSKIVYAIADGRDVGTIFEIGYARSKSIPVVVYSTLDLNHNSTMLEGTDCEIYDDFTTSIYKAVWKIMKE